MHNQEIKPICGLHNHMEIPVQRVFCVMFSSSTGNVFHYYLLIFKNASPFHESCLEKFWNLHSWRYSKTDRHSPEQPALIDAALSRKVGLDHL